MTNPSGDLSYRNSIPTQTQAFAIWLLAVIWITSGCVCLWAVFSQLKSFPSYVIPSLVAVLGIFSLAVGFGLAVKKLWAYIANIWVHRLLLVLGLLGLIVGISLKNGSDVVQSAIEVFWAIIWISFLRRSEVRALFGKSEDRKL
jgi:hypothetical protein